MKIERYDPEIHTDVIDQQVFGLHCHRYGVVDPFLRGNLNLGTVLLATEGHKVEGFVAYEDCYRDPSSMNLFKKVISYSQTGEPWREVNDGLREVLDTSIVLERHCYDGEYILQPDDLAIVGIVARKNPKRLERRLMKHLFRQKKAIIASSEHFHPDFAEELGFQRLLTCIPVGQEPFTFYLREGTP
jgi:hypothetical protein